MLFTQALLLFAIDFNASRSSGDSALGRLLANRTPRSGVGKHIRCDVWQSCDVPGESPLFAPPPSALCTMCGPARSCPGEAEHDTDTMSSNTAAGQCEMIREGEIKEIQVSRTTEDFKILEFQ